MEELNILRTQMAAMKQDLNQYKIVNDRLMRTVMSQRSAWMNWFVKLEIISIPFLIIFFWSLCSHSGISPWIAITMSIALVASAIADCKTMRISTKAISTYNLIALRSKLIRQKRMRIIQLIIESPLMIIWAAWFFIEYFGLRSLHANDSLFWAKIIAIALISALAIVAVMLIYYRAQLTNNTLIGQIESIENQPKRDN